MIGRTPKFRPGTPLTPLNRALESVDNLTRGVSTGDNAGQWGGPFQVNTYLALDTIRIEIISGTNPYAWKQVVMDNGDPIYNTFSDPYLYFGTASYFPAIEASGNIAVPPGAIVEGKIDRLNGKVTFAYQSGGGGSTTFTSITATTVIASIINATTSITAVTINVTNINATTATWTTGNIYNLDVIDNFYASGNAYMMIQNELIDWFPYLYATLDGNYGDGSYYGEQVEPDVHPAWWVPGPLTFDMLKEMNKNANVPTGVEVVIFAGDLLATDIDCVVSRVGGGTTNSEQTITYQAASGTFRLSLLGETTGNLAIGAAASDVKSAIEALTAVTQTVNVTKSGRVYVAEFDDDTTTIFDVAMVPYLLTGAIESREFYFHWFTAEGGGPFDYVDFNNQAVPPGAALTNGGRLFWSNSAQCYGYVNDAGLTRYIAGLANLPGTIGTIAVYNGTEWGLLTPGADGTVLTADSGDPLGVSWQ